MLALQLVVVNNARADSASGAALSPTSALRSEAEELVRQMKSGALLALSDDQLIKLFTELNPQTALACLTLGSESLNEYEIWMRREERLSGTWPSKPFVNYIKYRHRPRQVYVKWLKDSPKAGQEIIYDETKRKDAMLGHLGGLFNITSIWTAMDGILAKGNSNHTVHELGMQAIVSILANESKKQIKAGLPTEPNLIEVAQLSGERSIVLTWITPPGVTGSYASKAKIYVDLKQPWIRQIESWDARGELFERITFDRIVPARFTDADFDPDNPNYSF